MFSTLRNRFGIPGVISVIALVFAMFGGAYAASNSSDGGKATASAKAKQGPRGKTGKTGPAGPAGPQGPAGANGKDGANGGNGSNGSDGAPGQSVTSVPEPAGVKCPSGGYKLTSASGTQYVCNGQEGPAGPTETVLPSEAMSIGTWATPVVGPEIEVEGESGPELVPLKEVATISFPLSVEPKPEGHYINSLGMEVTAEGEVEPTHCSGTVELPNADPGHLCIYAEVEFGASPIIGGGLGAVSGVVTRTSGATAPFSVEAGLPNIPGQALGVWAVRAE